MLLKNWAKSSIIFIISVMYYAMVQLVYTISYMMTQNDSIMLGIINILRFVLLFAPIVIFILHFGFKSVNDIFFDFWKGHWIFYLLNVVILFFITENIVLGPYSAEISIIGLYFELNKNAFSDFFITYMYILFDINIKKICFFILLPSYFLIFTKNNRVKLYK